MTNYVFDLTGCTWENKKRGLNIFFTIDELKQVGSLGDSKDKILTLYETYYGQFPVFIGYVDGNHIGATLAKLVTPESLYKIPTRFDAHCYSDMPNRSKFELFSSNNNSTNNAILPY